jgi:hypothetical protein
MQTFKELVDLRKGPGRWETEDANGVRWWSTLPIIVVRHIQERSYVRLPKGVCVERFR